MKLKQTINMLFADKFFIIGYSFLLLLNMYSLMTNIYTENNGYIHSKLLISLIFIITYIISNYFWIGIALKLYNTNVDKKMLLLTHFGIDNRTITYAYLIINSIIYTTPAVISLLIAKNYISNTLLPLIICILVLFTVYNIIKNTLRVKNSLIVTCTMVSVCALLFYISSKIKNLLYNFFFIDIVDSINGDTVKAELDTFSNILLMIEKNQFIIIGILLIIFIIFIKAYIKKYLSNIT